MLILVSHKTYACWCHEKSKSLEKEFDSRDLIFKGKVSSIDTLIYADTVYRSNNRKRGKNYDVIYVVSLVIKVDILATYKGSGMLHNASIITGLGDGDCGFPFDIGSNYIIYADKQQFHVIENFDSYRSKGGLSSAPSRLMSTYSTNICTWTAAFDSERENKLKALSISKNGR